MIDELETHLHPSMQERILPFLVQAFPEVQFIAVTHSPAVIGSVDTALIWDLKSGKDAKARLNHFIDPSAPYAGLTRYPLRPKPDH